MLVIVLTFALFLIIAFLPFTLENLFSPRDLKNMGVRLGHSSPSRKR